MAYEISLATAMGISVLFALSLNFITGFCGQISLGHAAFLGVGAYVSGMLLKAGWPLLATLPFAALAAGLVGIGVGLTSLRVRHDFLAITTMGVGFLFVGIVRQQDALGGELGISGIPSSALGKPGFLVLVIVCAALFALFSLLVRRSWMGRAFDAIAEDEDTARVLGIDVAGYKLAAFAIGTAVAGIAGASMVIVGGIGSIAGVAVTAAVLSALPLWFQFIDDYKLLLYSALLFAMMRFCPDGLAGLARRLMRRITQRSARP
jgi:branched-chain amino acid transport system permease protein